MYIQIAIVNILVFFTKTYIIVKNDCFGNLEANIKNFIPLDMELCMTVLVDAGYHLDFEAHF